MEVQDDGILLTWTPTTPPNGAIIAVQNITLMAASQMSVQALPAPSCPFSLADLQGLFKVKKSFDSYYHGEL